MEDLHVISKCSARTKTTYSMTITGVSSLGVAGGAMTPPDFGRSVNSTSQPGEQIMPTTIVLGPTDFQTLQRPWVVERKAHRSKAASKQMDESAFI